MLHNISSHCILYQLTSRFCFFLPLAYLTFQWKTLFTTANADIWKAMKSPAASVLTFYYSFQCGNKHLTVQCICRHCAAFKCIPERQFASFHHFIESCYSFNSIAHLDAAQDYRLFARTELVLRQFWNTCFQKLLVKEHVLKICNQCFWHKMYDKIRLAMQDVKSVRLSCTIIQFKFSPRVNV